MRVLLVEDDRAQLQNTRSLLEEAGFEVTAWSSAACALRWLHRERPHIVVLDRWLPDGDGLDIVAWVRKNYGNTLPVIMLTSAVLETELVHALNTGADDYLVKPARASELLARIHALLRRYRWGNDQATRIELGPYVLDLRRRTVTLNGMPIALTIREYAIAELLFSNVGVVIPRHTISIRAWGADESPESRTLDTHIYRVRKKLKLCRENHVTVRMIYMHGYRLEYVDQPNEAMAAGSHSLSEPLT